MPRKKFYDAHRVEVLEKQRTRRRLEKERIQKALAELERLEHLQQQKLDREAFESAELKKLIRKMQKEGSESEEISGAKIW
jgi:uncharacterized protein YabN with tetrapyrrole methylase and pyrophosphatase domain